MLEINEKMAYQEYAIVQQATILDAEFGIK